MEKYSRKCYNISWFLQMTEINDFEIYFVQTICIFILLGRSNWKNFYKLGFFNLWGKQMLSNHNLIACPFPSWDKWNKMFCPPACKMLLSQITALQYYCRVLFLGRTLLKTVGAEKKLSQIISPDMYFEITCNMSLPCTRFV